MTLIMVIINKILLVLAAFESCRESSSFSCENSSIWTERSLTIPWISSIDSGKISSGNLGEWGEGFWNLKTRLKKFPILFKKVSGIFHFYFDILERVCPVKEKDRIALILSQILPNVLSYLGLLISTQISLPSLPKIDWRDSFTCWQISCRNWKFICPPKNDSSVITAETILDPFIKSLGKVKEVSFDSVPGISDSTPRTAFVIPPMLLSSFSSSSVRLKIAILVTLFPSFLYSIVFYFYHILFKKSRQK